MTEAFLHYLWKHRLFDMNRLVADDGTKVEVVKPGEHNHGSGPDFFNAQLRLDGLAWAGNVEIHIRSSDWHRHRHHLDPVYDSCILHVVYENDSPTLRMNGTKIPTIHINDRYPKYLMDNYLKLVSAHGWVSCDRRLPEMDPQTIHLQLEKMISERLKQRAGQVIISLKGLKNDWEECFFQLLAKNFGFHDNALPFEMLARSLPLKILKREKGLENAEALLFGQAGLLEKEINDPYHHQLHKLYLFYQTKYALKPIPGTSWKFMRLRPVNFPTIRIAQFADLMTRSNELFSKIIEADSMDTLLELIDCTASAFWNTHFHFNTPAESHVKKMGRSSLHSILINTIFPVLIAWGEYSGDHKMFEKVVEWMSHLPAEENTFIRQWHSVGVKARSAADSQALLQLKMNYCSEKKCLSCAIGNKLINSLP